MEELSSKLIIDVGAHKGEDTLFYLKKGFRVVAVEPNPDLIGLIESRCGSYLQEGLLTVLNVAISDKVGFSEFYVHELTEWSSLFRGWKQEVKKFTGSLRVVKVRTKTLAEIIEEYGAPYYLKIDAEGADYLCLSSLLKTQVRPVYLSFEPSKRSWKGIFKEFRVLSDLGYCKFKIINQHNVRDQVEPFPSREGKHCGASFEFGSSGLFGKDLSGRWLSQAEALFLYSLIVFQNYLFGNGTFGERVVRKLPRIFRKFLLPTWHDIHASQ